MDLSSLPRYRGQNDPGPVRQPSRDWHDRGTALGVVLAAFVAFAVTSVVLCCLTLSLVRTPPL